MGKRYERRREENEGTDLTLANNAVLDNLSCDVTRCRRVNCFTSDKQRQEPAYDLAEEPAEELAEELAEESAGDTGR